MLGSAVAGYFAVIEKHCIPAAYLRVGTRRHLSDGPRHTLPLLHRVCDQTEWRASSGLWIPTNSRDGPWALHALTATFCTRLDAHVQLSHSATQTEAMLAGGCS